MTDPGFSISDRILSPNECEALASAVGSAAHGRAGARNLMSNKSVSSLAHDVRLRRLAHNLLGTDAVPYRATLFDKSSAANWQVLWHQDRALPLLNKVPGSEWGPWSTKSGVRYALAPRWALERIVALRIHLDASTEENGPLRVIPGSHRAGVMGAADISKTINTEPSVSCLVGRGGVLAMRPLLLHSSSRVTGTARRRVLHIEYAQCLDFGNGAHLCVT